MEGYHRVNSNCREIRRAYSFVTRKNTGLPDALYRKDRYCAPLYGPICTVSGRRKDAGPR